MNESMPNCKFQLKDRTQALILVQMLIGSYYTNLSETSPTILTQ